MNHSDLVERVSIGCVWVFRASFCFVLSWLIHFFEDIQKQYERKKELRPRRPSFRPAQGQLQDSDSQAANPLSGAKQPLVEAHPKNEEVSSTQTRSFTQANTF